MNKKSIKRITTDKSRARDIVNEIINFGVNDNQKIHVMFLLALNLESGDNMREISKFLKNYQENINTDEEDDKIKLSKPKKTILT